MFLAKLGISRALRVCQENNATNGNKTQMCMKDYDDKCNKVVCPIVKSCLPNDK